MFVRRPSLFITALICANIFFSFFSYPGHAHAQVPRLSDNLAPQASLKDQIEDLNHQVKSKRGRVKELGQVIAGYSKRITEQEAKQTSLATELLLLDTRIRTKELDIERIKVEVDILSLEINALQREIEVQRARIEHHKELAVELMRRMRAMGDISIIEVLVGAQSLSSFFDRLHEVKQLEGDVIDALAKVQAIKKQLEEKKQEQGAKRVALVEATRKIQREQLVLEAEHNLKLSLVTTTRLRQTEFERVLSELREQQQTTIDDISVIEETLKEKLDDIDAALARGDLLLNWPVDPSRGITATFHDPTYPFRHLFEHPGTDIRAHVGTSVRAAAGGYLAWNKRGRLYGNYTMLIHPGNVATVYAHLSRFLAKPDTYVERGHVIAESGGRPGDPGAGLSTGPHLHFEVRKNGIPIDPQNYLPSAASGEGE